MPKSLTHRGGGYRTTLLLGSLAAALVASIIAFPDKALQASLEGITIWWNIVFPALLPFMILTELLLGFGVVHALGTLLEPLARLLLRLPGTGGLALAAGALGGFPSGALFTAKLRGRKLLTRGEGERLLALSHLASPVLIVTVIGTGFLHSPRLGLLLAGVHYGGALLLGFVLPSQKKPAGAPAPGQPESADGAGDSGGAAGGSAAEPARAHTGSGDARGRAVRADAPAPGGEAPPVKRRGAGSGASGAPLWRQAAGSLVRARSEDGRAFGQLLGEAVTASVQSLMVIGGYIMIFSVIIHMLTMPDMLQAAGGLLGLPVGPDLLHHLASGLFELHLGAHAAAGEQALPQGIKLALIAAFLGFGGLSSHAQALSAAYGAGLRYLPFLMARLLHACFSYLLVLLLWRFTSGLFPSVPSGRQTLEVSGTLSPIARTGEGALFSSLSIWMPAFAQLGFLLLVLAAGCILSYALHAFAQRRLHTGPKA
ncbi:sporulation integral membrane protein YlbJ [Paenibacillus sp. HGH0039]|uniref:sporulation integral membrane protein YlbJ n=1 Tax=Paenibacillus sp. HGH0039 TaxID=1078505 RepID=UPI00034E9C04|nr:sporulation integral membrane protein YlbJ [Paenibacillus sp. HGH0039]EPD92114.1 sporulation integral membrane protein YlbJ [Paenibacillus sp. HGH0039]